MGIALAEAYEKFLTGVIFHVNIVGKRNIPGVSPLGGHLGPIIFGDIKFQDNGVLFLSTGAMITGRVGRWDTTAAFLLCFALLEAVRNIWLGWTWDVYQHQMLNGALLLFAFFMITDPRTIPDDRLSRVCWSIAIAVVTFILLHVFFVNGAVIWALFIMSPFSVLFDRWRLAPRFNWYKERVSHLIPDKPDSRCLHNQL